MTGGARGTISTMGDLAEVGVAGPRCYGGMSGTIERTEDGVRIVGEGCTLTLTPGEDGRTEIAEGMGCSMYHGASCSFSGTVLGPAMPLDIEAVESGFARLGLDERRALQSALQTQGLYDSTIDGKMGPGTRGAIIDAAREMHAEDTAIRMDVAAFAEVVMRRMMAPKDPIALDAALPFMGRYDCEGMAEMVFAPDSYIQSGIDMAYAHLEPIAETLWGIEFQDGYRIAVEADGSGWITWQSVASGDTFRCRKIGG